MYVETRNREDWRTAVLVSTLLNLHRTKESQPITNPSDVMPWLAEKQSPQQMRAILAAVTLDMGGTVAPRHGPAKPESKKARKPERQKHQPSGKK